jgi:polyisoprenoid-binding protein YceI
MKGFLFEKALMEEHFNENYVESSKFPKAEFKGLISNNASVNYSKEGSYNVSVKGRLTLHGETRDIQTEGKLTIKGGRINATATFQLPFDEYKIAVPLLVSDKVAKTASIEVECSMEPLK